ncbi:cysteine desulfurase/selenocysteine lyase [Arcticibacter tournemirensis]|uniref:Cysteine desulfurase n=1 Tax=Arcticibacter tournemirensis TaxID=699437 RepID=A0A5M9HE34_9SPHI|nr:cysteine desulfurase [Arcticibacter tournemirensis]KAA8485040.1 cysteine desulfurase [Arcticibacter tournemirensis]TQM50504.1 cysteine desulfurase/selenocysteine lyase [Arcticibacter tournemirensis]
MEVNTENIVRQFLYGGEPIGKQFPALHQSVYGKPLVYFDNAATTQKPYSVIHAISEYYSTINSNIHRGVHHLSQKATDAYEVSRNAVAAFINSRSSSEVIFTKGTTDGINLIADVYGSYAVKEGDSVIISAMEHHSNIVPWQIMCEKRGAVLKVIPMNENGELLMDEFERMLDERVKIVAVTYISNTLGTINPVKRIIELAHANGTPVLIDAAQAVQHVAVDVQDLDCDFLAFSGHKMYGPTGIGILYGKEEWLEKLPPYQGGGDMIKTVTFTGTEYNELPFKYEAGTPHIEGAITLKSAVDFITELGVNEIAAFENGLLQYTTSLVTEIPGIDIIGTAKAKAGALSLSVKGVHPYDVGVLLDKMGIAVRTGHHCTQPVMDFYCIPGTVRLSFAVYNTIEEIDYFISSLKRAINMLV